MTGEGAEDDDWAPPSDEGESTIATSSPVFDSSVPSPISVPPPVAAPTPAPTPASTPGPRPGAGGTAKTPAAAPVQRPGTSPIAFDKGGAFAPPGGAEKPPNRPAGAGFRAPPRRGQTVIGIAPPASPNVPSPISVRPGQSAGQGARANPGIRPPGDRNEAATAPRIAIDDIPDFPEEPPPPKTPDPPPPAPALGVSRRSPLASTGFVPGGPGALPVPLATGGPSDDDESTRAVARSELTPDRHVVRGDAVGDEATLAVSPGMNAVNVKHMAALAATVLGEEGAPPPPPAPPAAAPPPSWNDYPRPVGTAPGIGPGSAGQLPIAAPLQGPGMGQTSQMHGPMSGGPHPNAHGSQSSGEVWPMSPPSMPMSGPMSGPMGGPSVGPGMAPHGYPYAQAQMPMAPPGWPPQPARYPAGGGFKPSRQLIVLGIVGFVCIGIFITGIILFATTKF